MPTTLLWGFPLLVLMPGPFQAGVQNGDSLEAVVLPVHVASTKKAWALYASGGLSYGVPCWWTFHSGSVFLLRVSRLFSGLPRSP